MLNIDMQFHKGIMFIRLKGELVKSTICQLDAEVTSLIKENGVCNIVFNISMITSIDHYGITSLLNNYEICKKNNGRSLLCGINKYVKNEINSSKILNYIDETTSEISALNIINLKEKLWNY